MLQFKSGDYVKFVRTTTAVWNQLPSPKKNNDTLYFVLDNEKTSGSLYLGAVLIASNVPLEVPSLATLKDVFDYTNIELANGSILVWDTLEQRWKPVSLLVKLMEITSTLTVMEGATATKNGEKGVVPAPKAGQQSYMLTGDGKWTNPVPIISTFINTKASQWFGMSDWVANLNEPRMTVREIATDEVNKVIDNAPNEYNTLNKVANWINGVQHIPSDVSILQTQINYLEDVVISGVPATQPGQTAVPSLIEQVSNLTTQQNSLHTDVAEIQNTLRWHAVQ